MNDLYFLEKSSSGTKEINLKTKMMENRVLYLDDEVNSSTINELCQAMLLLSLESPKPITLVINSPGGSISDGLLLIDTMAAIPNDVITVATGLAASMGAVILAAGTKRYTLRHSKTMIHEPLLRNGVAGSCSSIQATAESIAKTKKLINELLAGFCNKSIKAVEKATSFDNYLDAAESVKFGLCDEIIEDEKLYTILTGKGV